MDNGKITKLFEGLITKSPTKTDLTALLKELFKEEKELKTSIIQNIINKNSVKNILYFWRQDNILCFTADEVYNFMSDFHKSEFGSALKKETYYFEYFLSALSDENFLLEVEKNYKNNSNMSDVILKRISKIKNIKNNKNIFRMLELNAIRTLKDLSNFYFFESNISWLSMTATHSPEVAVFFEKALDRYLSAKNINDKWSRMAFTSTVSRALIGFKLKEKRDAYIRRVFKMQVPELHKKLARYFVKAKKINNLA